VLYCGSRLYFAGHTPLWAPDYGYIAVSEDDGRTWREIPGSPWTKERNSVFRCLMFINMGQNYQLNRDGYVYGLGAGWEWDWDIHGDGRVFLARAPQAKIADYNAYEYYAGASEGQPLWSADQTAAAPVPGLITDALGSAMYHEGTQRYLFLSQNGLFEARQPWGPWIMSARLFVNGPEPEWQGGYMPAIIAKDAGPDSFYFFISGQDCVIGYKLHLGRARLLLRKNTP